MIRLTRIEAVEASDSTTLSAGRAVSGAAEHSRFS